MGRPSIFQARAAQRGLRTDVARRAEAVYVRYLDVERLTGRECLSHPFQHALGIRQVLEGVDHRHGVNWRASLIQRWGHFEARRRESPPGGLACLDAAYFVAPLSRRAQKMSRARTEIEQATSRECRERILSRAASPRGAVAEAYSGPWQSQPSES